MEKNNQIQTSFADEFYDIKRTYNIPDSEFANGLKFAQKPNRHEKPLYLSIIYEDLANGIENPEKLTRLFGITLQ
jgi:hypothetical protein